MASLPIEVSRIHELDLLAAEFRRNEWCAVMAPPLSGRTTLARQAVAEFSRRFPSWQFTLLDLEPAATLAELWEQIQRKANWKGVAAQPLSDGRVLLADELARAVAASPKPIGLIIDNLDVQTNQVLRQFADELRRLRNDSEFREQRHRLYLILFGGLKLYYLSAGPNSPLSTIIERIPLSDLSEEQSARLFCKRTGLESLDRESESTLFAETNGHPHLVQCLAEALATAGADVSADKIRQAADRWANAALLAVDPNKDCFARIIYFLERHWETFELMLGMLDLDGLPMAEFGRMDHLLSGAISERDGHYQFRGGMIRNALALYFDPLRRADFTTFHGDWPKANGLYSTIAANLIRQRRTMGTALSLCRMMDLFQNVSPYSMRHRTLPEAIDFVVASGHHFLGADQVYLWHQAPQHGLPQIVGRFPSDVEVEQGDFHRGLVESAMRNNETFSLHSNQGTVCGIGDQSAVTHWALELKFQSGVPDDDWFQDGLQRLEPVIFMILDRARHREADEAKSHRQRTLIHKIGLASLSANNVTEVFDLIVGGVTDRLEYESAQLCLVFREQNELRAVKANGVFGQIKDLTVRPLDGDDPLAVVVATKEPRNVKDTLDPKEKCNLESAELAGIKSFVAVPMIDHDQAVGVLQVGSTQPDAFRQRDLELLQLLAVDAAVAIRLARGRTRLNQVLEFSGTAMAFIDASGRIEYCNQLYEEFFDVELNDPTQLCSDAQPPVPLVRQAFDQADAITTVRSQNDRMYLVTAAAVVDPFQRYAGGIEVIGTRNPVLGLSESLRDMFTITERTQLEQAIVKCLVQRLGYSRARLYRSVGSDRLTSSCSLGMSEEARKWFDAGKAVLEKDSNSGKGDGFECVRHDGPLIFVNHATSTEAKTLPLSEITRDKSNRQIIVVDLAQVAYTKELEKEGLAEWVDVPLGPPSQPLGKLSVDVKGSVRHLGLEDAEILALFGRWAADALARVLTLERVQEQAKFVRDARVAGDRRGLEAMVWDFLLNITLQGGAGFNRAAVLLRNPQTGLYHGFLCHGEPNSAAWATVVKDLPTIADRRQFLIDARREKMDQPLPPDNQQRQELFRKFVVQELDPHSEIAAAIRGKKTVTIRKPGADLHRLCEALEWQECDEALLCPLLFDGECEGLVYADRVFTKDATITASDAELLEADSYNLAMIARPLRLAEQLRSRMLGVTHTAISPAAAIRALAEGLMPSLEDAGQRQVLELMVAEAQRSADLYRRVLRAAAGGTVGLAPKFRTIDLVSILKERIQPYLLVLKTDGVTVEICAPGEVVAELDPDLWGDVVAELATNASTAIQRALDMPRAVLSRATNHNPWITSSLSARSLMVDVEADFETSKCRITFENSGPTIPLEAQAHIWDRFVSASGGTGIGLWLVKEIVGLHHGEIEYRITNKGLSAFDVTLPLRQKEKA